MIHYFKNKSTMKKAFLVIALALLLVSVNSVSAQTIVTTSTSNTGACGNLTTTGLTGVAACIINILDSITVIIIAASVVYIIYGAFEMIRSEEKRESGRQTIIYGIIGLFAMISIWGFVNILDSTFRLRQNYIPAPQFHQ